MYINIRSIVRKSGKVEMRLKTTCMVHILNYFFTDRGLQKASNDEQLLLIHDTEKILGHHDRYFPGGKPLEFTPSSLLPQLGSDESTLHDIVKSRNLDKLIHFLEVFIF